MMHKYSRSANAQSAIALNTGLVTSLALKGLGPLVFWVQLVSGLLEGDIPYGDFEWRWRLIVSENVILVVDDDPCWRASLEMLLPTYGFPVLSAGDGLQAIEAAIAYHPALIVMDINMPGMSGYAATRVIREFRQTADIPIVGVSGNNDVTTSRKAVEAGMTDFVPKPWSDSDIARALRHISSAGSKPPSAA